MKTKTQEEAVEEWNDCDYDHVFKLPAKTGDFSLCGTFVLVLEIENLVTGKIEPLMRYPDQSPQKPSCPICDALKK